MSKAKYHQCTRKSFSQKEKIFEVKEFKTTKLILMETHPSLSPTSEEMAKVVLERMGLMPRKKGATDKMHRTLTELYERAKRSYRHKRPQEAVMTVEEMGFYAGITRQTMYDYLKRWIDLGLLVKTSYITEGKVIIGYKLNGNTLEQAFERAMQTISQNLDITKKYIREMQRLVKNEKIAETQQSNVQTTLVEKNIKEVEVPKEDQQKLVGEA
jgi:predicted transcriptional regulator